MATEQVRVMEASKGNDSHGDKKKKGKKTGLSPLAWGGEGWGITKEESKQPHKSWQRRK